MCCPHEVLLGNDLEFFYELYRTAHTDTHTTPQVKAITRAGARKQMEEEERNETLNKRDAAKPTPVNSEHGATHNPVVREWVKIVVVYLLSLRKLHYLYPQLMLLIVKTL